MPNTRETQIKEKLVELIASKECDYYSGVYETWVEHDCEKCGAENCSVTLLADHLIANGVTILTVPESNKINIKLPKEIALHPYTAKWISVKDRVPDTAERVLVSETWLGTVRKPQYGYFQKHPNQEGCWYILTDHGYYPRTSTEITHWMPLPPAPKGE